MGQRFMLQIQVTIESEKSTPAWVLSRRLVAQALKDFPGTVCPRPLRSFRCRPVFGLQLTGRFCSWILEINAFARSTVAGRSLLLQAAAQLLSRLQRRPAALT